MGIDDWLICVGLIYAIIRQIRPRHVNVIGLSWPVALVVWAAFEYLAKIPSYFSDWMFTGVLGVIGLGLGLGAGVYTRIYLGDDKVMAKATATAATLWIVGMVSRVAFGVVALSGGANAIGQFSDTLHLHSVNTWPTALITMALCEVLSRTAVLLIRYQKVNRTLRAQRQAKAAAAGNGGVDSGADQQLTVDSDQTSRSRVHKSSQ